MAAGDFEGKFKVSWDENYLYVLVEILDNMLSDDHADPLQNWWDDDCLEVFIDEDRSGGDHERNTNAFAYHVSLFYDAIDLSSTGSGINYKDHINVDMDTLGGNRYLWEMAIKIYDQDYNNANPEASRLQLYNEKLMGFTIAYCDNDEAIFRENFIGSVYVPQANYNDSYKNADFFGTMLLKADNTGIGLKESDPIFKVYPSPSSSIIKIESREGNYPQYIEIYDLKGSLLIKKNPGTSNAEIDISELKSGIYMLMIKTAGKNYFEKIVKK
jgi:hypothetical protein